MNARMLPIFLFLGAILLLEGCTGDTEVTYPTPRDTVVSQSSEEELGAGLEVDVFCSPIRIRTGVASVTWEVSPEFVEEQELAVTVFKDGFEKNVYGRISPFRPEKQFEAPRLKPQDREMIQPISGLVVVDSQYDKEEGSEEVTVLGLEAGLNYYWRLTTVLENGERVVETVRVEAPVCVADMKDDTSQTK